MPPLRLKRRESLMTGTAMDSSTDARDKKPLTLADINRRHREYYQGEKPAKRGTDDELPSTYSLAEMRELNRLKRFGITASLAERVQHRREDVERPASYLNKAPVDI